MSFQGGCPSLTSSAVPRNPLPPVTELLPAHKPGKLFLKTLEKEASLTEIRPCNTAGNFFPLHPAAAGAGQRLSQNPKCLLPNSTPKDGVTLGTAPSDNDFCMQNYPYFSCPAHGPIPYCNRFAEPVLELVSPQTEVVCGFSSVLTLRGVGPRRLPETPGSSTF